MPNILKIQRNKIDGKNGILKLVANILFIKYKVRNQTMGLSGRVHRGVLNRLLIPGLA